MAQRLRPPPATLRSDPVLFTWMAPAGFFGKTRVSAGAQGTRVQDAPGTTAAAAAE